MPDRTSTALSRLLAALTRPPSRGQALAAVLLALVGFATAVQVRANDDADVYPGARRGDLVRLLDTLDAARSRAEQELIELQAVKLELANSTTAKQAALEKARQEADALAILAGAVPATGTGVIVRIEDPRGSVRAATMLNAVEELRDAGAEAIEINDTARVVAQTYFADAEAGITVDGTLIQPPYTVDAIGSAQTLSVAVEFPGGLRDEVEALGGSVEVESAETVEVTALAEQDEPEYAAPTP